VTATFAGALFGLGAGAPGCIMPANMIFRLAFVAALGGLAAVASHAENWPQWRGPYFNGSLIN